MNPLLRSWAPALVSLSFATLAAAQSATSDKTVTLEPGIEKALGRSWKVAPSELSQWAPELPPSDGSIPAPAPVPETASQPSATSNAPLVPQTDEARPSVVVVQSGDTLGKIAERFGISISQLKAFNGMSSDKLLRGKKLKIPTLAEAEELVKRAPVVTPDAGDGKEPTVVKPVYPAAAVQHEDFVYMQCLLDRNNYSQGAIDGVTSRAFRRAVDLCTASHPEYKSVEALKGQSMAAIGQAYVFWTLRQEGMRFIAVPPAGEVQALLGGRFLAYRSAWEFVAERFHVDEAFLRKINPALKGEPGPGTEFLVPNTEPFEIEHAFKDPLQPAADPASPVAALVKDGFIEVTKGGKLVGAFPVYPALVTLRPKGEWIVREVLPRPQYLSAATASAPAAAIGPGPNNPAGILWIHISTPKDEKHVEWGFSGSSLPTGAAKVQSIGGIRMTNWDAIRLARLVPAGTPLTWK